MDFLCRSWKALLREEKSAIQTAIDITEDNAIRVDKSAGKSSKTSQGDGIDFEAYLDPRLTTKILVKIYTVDVSGVFKIKSYDFTSSTDNGDHLMSGAAVPTDAEYRVIYPGEN